ncbi:reverse transcriptase domain-containing protein [Tanacetum coccineum]
MERRSQKVRTMEADIGSQDPRLRIKTWEGGRPCPQAWVCEEIDPFTPRIRYFDFPKTRMPNHIKRYDGSEDPKDLLKIFLATAKTKRWAMPTWCHMFNSTLTGNARVWFDDLPAESIDNYDDLKKAFLENYLQQNKCIKDPIEIHNIKQRDGESTEDFVKRGEVAASNHERKKLFPPWKQQEGEDEGTEGPMIIEAEIGGHCIHRMYVDGRSASEILANTTAGKDWRRRALHFGLDELSGCKVTISVQWNYWKTMSQKITSGSVNSSWNAEAPGRGRSNYLKKQQVGPVGMCVGLRTKRDPFRLPNQ